MADSASSLIGFAGTMVCAVFETLGYQYQSRILDEFSGAFQGEVGGLIYLIGVTVAIFAMATRGQYRLTAWLLVGPPIFFAVIMKRSDVGDAQWAFARQPRPQQKVTDELARLYPSITGGAATKSVSTLFAKYNKLISNTSQELMKIINPPNKTETDKWFIIKAQLLTHMYTVGADDPGLIELIRYGMLGQCRDAVEAARTLKDNLATTTQKKEANLNSRLTDQRGDIHLTKSAADYVATVIFSAQNGSITDQLLAGNVSGIIARQSDYEKTRLAVERHSFSCGEIWGFIYFGLMRKGVFTLKEAVTIAKGADINTSKLFDQLAKAAGVDGSARESDGSESLMKLVKVVALYTLRNTARTDGSSGKISAATNQSREYKNIEIPLEGELSTTEMARVTGSEWAEKTRLMMAASNLPYYQGLLLFFLAAAFPFFALLLLVPGKHPAFILWFVLWLWVKSWDVALAIVMQIDDVLFALLAMNKRPFPSADILPDDMQLALLSMREIDPTMHIATYYNILAVCVLSIPTVTSQVILGSLTGGAGLVASGLNMFSGEFARSAQSTQMSTAISGLRYQLADFKQAQVESAQTHRMGLPQKSFGGAMPGSMQADKIGEKFRLSAAQSIVSKPKSKLSTLGGFGGPGDAGYPNRALPSISPNGRDLTAPGALGRILTGGGAPDTSLVQEAQDPLARRNRDGSVAKRVPVSANATIDSMTRSSAQPFQDQVEKLVPFKALQGIARSMHSPTTFSADIVERFMVFLGRRQAFQNLLHQWGGSGLERAKGFARMADGTIQAMTNYTYENINQDLNVTASWAGGDAIYSDRGTRLTFLIKLYGALEVPLTWQEAGDNTETDKLLALREKEYEAYAAVFDGFASMISAGKSAKAMSDQDENFKRAYNRFLGAGGNPASMNWGDKAFRQFIGGLSDDTIKFMYAPGASLRGLGTPLSMAPAAGFGGAVVLDDGEMADRPMLAMDFGGGRAGGFAAEAPEGRNWFAAGDGDGRGAFEVSPLLASSSFTSSVSVSGGGRSVVVADGGDGGGPRVESDSHDEPSGLPRTGISSNLFAYASVENNLFDPSKLYESSVTADAGKLYERPGQSEEHHVASTAFEPVDLERRGEGTVGERDAQEKQRRKQDLLALVGFGELPIDLPADLKFIIENNPTQADEAIAEYLRRRNAKKDTDVA